jgi:uncharacterized protein YfaS (alpha-2-macroglobulin family)
MSETRLRLSPGWLVVSLIAVSLACSMPGIGRPTSTPTSSKPATATLPPPTPTPAVPLPAALAESVPQAGAELPLNSPITLYFNQPMDRASVEGALDIPVSGSLTWLDDATLSFTPAEPLQPATQLALNLGTEARSAQGLTLEAPLQLTYQTAGNLELVQRLPVPEINDVDPSSAVVAAFSRPVVALGADAENLPRAFELQPPAEGRGEWLNTSTYIFYPQPALLGGTAYTVQVNPGLLSTDGSPLGGETNWTFYTASPRLLSVNPGQEARYIRLDSTFELTFNQPMQPASTEAAFNLRTTGGELINGSFTWNDDLTLLTFTPTARLPRGAALELSLRASAQAAGGTPLSQPFSVRYNTFPPLGITSTTPEPLGAIPPDRNVVINFSAPIDEDTLEAALSVVPAVSNLNTWWNSWDLSLNIHATFAPNTEYQISLSSALQDEWGSPLAEPYSLTFRTGAVSPNFSIPVGSNVLFLNSSDTFLPARATNIFNANISLGAISLDEFLTMVSSGGYQVMESFQPNQPQTWSQSLNTQSDINETVQLQLNPAGAALAPGLYFMRMRFDQPNLTGGPFLIVVGGSQLTYKHSASDVLIWSVDSNNFSPLSGRQVTVYDENGSVLVGGQTQADGIFRSAILAQDDSYRETVAVLGQPGQADFGLALASWNQGLSPWDFDIPSGTRPPGLRTYLYSDRPIYRPGDTIYFRAVVRQAQNGRYSLPDQSNVSLKLFDGLGQEVSSFDLGLSAFGTAHGSYTIPEGAATGYYSLVSDDGLYDNLAIQVAEYRKPEINLQVAIDQEEILSSAGFNALINTRYFFDAPAGNLPVEWSLYVSPQDFFIPGYQTGSLDFSWMQAFRFPSFFDSLGIQVAQGASETAPDGTLTLEFPGLPENEAVNPGLRQRYTLEVVAKDESGLPVAGRASVIANPAEFYIGLRPDNWIGQAQVEAGFEVQVVDWAKQPAGVRSLRATFQKVVWERIEGETSFEGPQYEPVYTPIASTDFTTNAQGQARLAFTPPEPGTYQLTVEGDGAKSDLLLWVGGAGQAVWPNLPNQRLRLTADRESYLPGDTARLFVPNPFPSESQALLTVERGEVLRHELLNLPPGGMEVELPLLNDDAPNVYASVTLLGRGEAGSSDFRFGLLNLNVTPLEYTLNVALTSSPQKTGPGDEVTFEIMVTDQDGNPVEGEFSLSVVDLAALALADPNAQDILPAFYGQQGLGVRTSLTLAAHPGRLLNMPGGLGGGGGDMVAEVVRENFPDTAYWNAEIVTDADGKASVTIVLPDSLTTWQVDLRGITQQSQVGQAQAQVITSKDLLIRPVTPRFFVAGDHSLLAAVAQNNTTNDLTIEVNLQANGFTLDDTSLTTQTVQVPAGGRQRVEWWGTVQDVAELDVVFASRAEGGLEDAARPALGALPVLHYNAPRTFSTAGVLDQSSQRLELVSLPRSFDPAGGGGLQIELSPSLAAGLLDALTYLEHYPYECTEQTLSRFLPNLETYRALQEVGSSSAALQAQLERTLTDGLERLQGTQNQDGGWSWWAGGASDPYVTTYVVFGLSRARAAGIEINTSALQRATDFLLSSMLPLSALENATPDAWQLDRLAFTYFALAEASIDDLSGVRNLAQYSDRLSPWAQGLLALTLDKLAPGDTAIQEILSGLQVGALRSASGAYWELAPGGLQNMHTQISNSALVLYALARLEPASPLLSDSARHLMVARQAGNGWNATYTTAWSIMALAEYMKTTGELAGEYTFGASLNGTPLVSGQAGGTDRLTPVLANVPLTSLYPDYPNALQIDRSQGGGRLYYTADLRVNQPVEQVGELEQGLRIERGYFPNQSTCLEEDCPAVDAGRTGEMIRVRLTLTLPQDAYYLLIEDYLPAGAEILDTSLKTSQKGTDVDPVIPLYEGRNPYAQGWGWWYFHTPRIYDERIAWAADYVPAGAYELTYTMVLLQPGEYRVLPARGWQFYFPDVQGHTAGEIFRIEP